jgi:hypothetical protein
MQGELEQTIISGINEQGKKVKEKDLLNDITSALGELKN